MSAEPAPVFVKTCGLRSVSIAEAAIAAGTDAIGIMLAPSKRQISLEDAIALHRTLAATQAHLPLIVAVTVNPTEDDIRQIAASGVFDAIQLSGDEDHPLRCRIPASLQVWKALRPAPDVDPDELLHEVATWLEGEERVDRVLLDAFHPGAYGGSGIVGNWAVASEVAHRFPIILAGLNPENVGEAIAQVRPFGVDVSSGIETHGEKDPARIAEFVRTSRAGQPSSFR